MDPFLMTTKLQRRLVVSPCVLPLLMEYCFFVDPKQDHHKKCAIPCHLRNQILEESHSGPMAGHFVGEKLYKSLVTHWWWQGMYSDVIIHWYVLSSICNCQCCRTCEQAPTSPHSRVTNIPDYWSGYHGSPTHQVRKLPCCSFSGLPD